VLLLVGDVGTTPLRAVFAALPPGRVTLIYRPGDLSGTGIRRELSAVAAARGNRMYYVTGTGDQDAGPLSPARLQALIPVLRCHDVYLYGAPRLAAAAITALQAAGVPRRRICLVPARS
jgi:ferredoxin-NADP reductase